MTPIMNPLTVGEILKKVGDGTSLTVVVEIPFGDLLSRDLDELNEFMDEMILPADTGDRIGSSLSGISYRVVGHVEGHLQPNYFTAGSVLVEVTGEVEILED